MLKVVFVSSASGLKKHTQPITSVKIVSVYFMLEHRLNVRLGCFNQSLKSSITNFYFMPNKPNLMTILLKNPKLVETKKMEACRLVKGNCKQQKICHLIQKLTGLTSSQANLTGLVFSKPFLLG
ncbi:hypothetical protein PRUPE_1G478900 [Prunus persica]|uniref:Uncharacterized protein n=1 Tax=Prunus persica TaxID=3760 RepID=A0A251REG9_PRUPE|nr:hypothetical protein PRUPE_1G478900 [Prunus persica]